MRFDVRAHRDGAGHRLTSSPAVPGRVTLRRGMTNSVDLWQWCTSVARDRGPRAECIVIVESPDGVGERARFLLRGALPVKLRGPDLHAGTAEVAIEELELAAESVSLVFPDERPAPQRVLAELRELDQEFNREINPKRWVAAHLNPASLDLAYARADASTGGQGSAALSVDLWLDASIDAGGTTAASRPELHEILRSFTYFVTPKAARGSRDVLPPAVRFSWGEFVFDGVVDSLNQSLDLFAADGRPGRARLSIRMSRPWIDKAPG